MFTTLAVTMMTAFSLGGSTFVDHADSVRVTIPPHEQLSDLSECYWLGERPTVDGGLRFRWNRVHDTELYGRGITFNGMQLTNDSSRPVTFRDRIFNGC